MDIGYAAQQEETNPAATAAIDPGLVSQLYRRYSADLAAVTSGQRDLRRRLPAMKAQLDDIEAEITYLLLRHFRPSHVAEIGALHGWSTTWILRALRDNGTGRLTTMDLAAGAVRNVPAALADNRWEFRQGDARAMARDWLPAMGYLFIDAGHSARFARWYLRDIVPYVPGRTPVSVHDVFHRRAPLPFTEGSELLRWMDREGLPYFTAAPAKAASVYRDLVALRRELGIAGAGCRVAGKDHLPGPSGGTARGRQDNPMLWFLSA